MPDVADELDRTQRDPGAALLHHDQDGRIHLPYVTMRRRQGEQWQFVYIVGTIHIGPQMFFKAIMKRIERWQAQQPTIVLAEGIRPSESPTDLAQEVQDVFDEGADGLATILEQAGYKDLVHQNEVMQPGSSWFNGDVTVSELLAALDLTDSGEDVFEETPVPAADQLVDYLSAGIGAASPGFLNMREDSLCRIIDNIFAHTVPASIPFANERALAVALPWGCMHMQGIRERLEMRGFEVRQRYWISLEDGTFQSVASNAPQAATPVMG